MESVDSDPRIALHYLRLERLVTAAYLEELKMGLADLEAQVARAAEQLQHVERRCEQQVRELNEQLYVVWSQKNTEIENLKSKIEELTAATRH